MPITFQSKKRRRNGKNSKVSIKIKLLTFKVRSLRLMLRLRILSKKNLI